MAVVMMMRWNGVTPEQYEEVRKLVDWEGNPAPGGLFHVAAFSESGLRVVDVWEDAGSFDAFVQQRLMPGVQQLGLTSQPDVEILPAHAIFAPGYAK